MSPNPQTSFLVGTFFAASYSKTALISLALIVHILLLNKQVIKTASNVVERYVFFQGCMVYFVYRTRL